MISVLMPNTSFTHLYSAVPLSLRRFRNRIRFFTDAERLLSQRRGGAVIVLRWFVSSNPQRPQDPVAFLSRLRDHFQTVVYFDDDDSTSSNTWHFLPLVDLFWKKQVLKDRGRYLAPMLGNRLFTDYYANQPVETSKAPESSFPVAPTAESLSKIRVTWSLGIGQYPPQYRTEKIVEGLFPLLGPSVTRAAFRFPAKRFSGALLEPFCQARFATKGYSELVAHQRLFFEKLVAGHRAVRVGFTDKKAYQSEMATASAVLSPFGWGEVCFRDFEAHQWGSVLIKPSMDHLETWPDTYLPGETFVPVRWDGSDLLETIDRVLADPAAGRRMAERAYEVWATAFTELEDRVERLLEELS